MQSGVSPSRLRADFWVSKRCWGSRSCRPTTRQASTLSLSSPEVSLKNQGCVPSPGCVVQMQSGGSCPRSAKHAGLVAWRQMVRLCGSRPNATSVGVLSLLCGGSLQRRPCVVLGLSRLSQLSMMLPSCLRQRLTKNRSQVLPWRNRVALLTKKRLAQWITRKPTRKRRTLKRSEEDIGHREVVSGQEERVNFSIILRAVLVVVLESCERHFDSVCLNMFGLAQRVQQCNTQRFLICSDSTKQTGLERRMSCMGDVCCLRTSK